MTDLGTLGTTAGIRPRNAGFVDNGGIQKPKIWAVRLSM